jgi:hypothetical protein
VGLVAITFGLSLAGYALLVARMAGAVAPAGRRLAVERFLARHDERLARAIGFVIVAHVYLIWNDRFGWDFERSLRSGWLNWILFHGAFVLLLLMTIAPKAGGHARTLLVAAWLAVTPGVSGAPFAYPFLGALKVPLLALVGLGAWVLLAAARRRRRG